MKADRTKQIPSYVYRNSTTPDHQVSPGVVKKKRKLQTTDTQVGSRFMDSLTQVDDADENINGTQNTVNGDSKQEHTITSVNEVTFIGTMSLEEAHNHIQTCLEMSSENKITPKNAFQLQLIDCMNLLLQKEDFSVMACTLEAGQKIYAYRIDSLHHQVIKLAEEVINNNKNKKTNGREDEREECGETMKRETRKASKKNVLCPSESIRRTLKSKDPKEKFIKIDGLPGAIMTSVKRDPKDFSFTLQNSVQFWHDWEKYKPVTVTGALEIPHCEIYRDKIEERKIGNVLRFSPRQNKTETVVNDILKSSTECSSDELMMDDLVFDDIPIDMEESVDNKSVEGEVDVISTAIKRLHDEGENNKDIATVPSHFEMMKMLFNQVSDYHYLNMQKANFWAGPEFWKRPSIKPSDKKERNKVVRKKKDPRSISYTHSAIEERLNTFLKKGSVVTKKTLGRWQNNCVTQALDVNIRVSQFIDLFFMSELQDNPESNEVQINVFETNDNIFEDDVNTDYSDSQDPLNDCFYENAPENSRSQEYRDSLNSAFYEAGFSCKTETPASDTGKILKVHFPSNYNNDTFLVSAPKIIHFEPIKYKTRPIRVDMQHLKQKMWVIINENNKGKQVDGKNPSGTLLGTKLSNILKQLPSKLEKTTAEDLFPGMALLALLTLANENNLQLKNCNDHSDVEIFLENEFQ